MRTNVFNKISDYLQHRFIHCDEIFVAYLQLQYEHHHTLYKATESMPDTIEQYKKQLASEKQTAKINNTQRQSSTSHSSDTKSQTSYQQTSQNGVKSTTSTSGTHSTRPRPLVQESESDESIDGSDSDPYETATDSDTDTTPNNNNNTQQTNRASRATSDVADILNFTGTNVNLPTSNRRAQTTASMPTNKSPRPLSNNSNNNSNSTRNVNTQSTSNADPLFDFFSPSSTTSQIKQSTTTPRANATPKNRSNNAQPDFFSTNDSTNASSTREPTFDFGASQQQPQQQQQRTNGIHQSKSYNDAFSHNKQQSRPTGKGFDSFDPFDSFTNKQQQQQLSHNDVDDTDYKSKPSSSISDSNINTSHTTQQPINPLSETSPYSLPYYDFQIEEKLSQWEKQPNNQTKHIRILLSTLHTVIWNSSNWKPYQLNELHDYSTIKKAHRKAILTVHPDKLVNAPDDTKRVAQHLFATLNSSFQLFDKAAKQGQLGF